MNAGGTIPMLAIFLLFLIFPIFEFPLPFADAETTLTTGSEVADEFFVEHVHQFYCKRVTINEFYRDDQCYAGPGQEIIGSFSIVLQFGLDGMLGTDGLIICFVGQLDGDSIARGLRVNEQYRIYNKWNHPLAKMCKEAKEKLVKKECQDPECYEFVNREWHAIQFKEHPNGRDLEMVMSTMDLGPGKIRIPRDQLENGLLVFKMTTADEASAKFSKTIGPGKHVSRRPSLLEKKNEVKVAMDEKLEGIFFGNIHHGARLRHFNGPFAVTVDFLPLMEGVHQIDVFVIRSECSDVPAAFLMPSDTTEMTPVTKQKPIPTDNKPINLKLNSTTYFRGHVPHATEKFVVQYNLKKKQNVSSIKMTVKFDGNDKDAYGNVEFEASFDGKKWMTLEVENMDRIKFYKGQQFLFKAVSKADQFLVSVNCGPFATVFRKATIGKIQTIWIEVHGVDIFNIWNPGVNDDVRKAEVLEFNSIKAGEGYYIEAKPVEDWEKISLELQYDNGKEVEVILLFEADRKENKMGIFYDQQEMLFYLEDWIKENENFEILFDLHGTNITVYIDGDVLAEMAIKHEKLEVNKIQIEADFKMEQNLTTIGTTSKAIELKRALANAGDKLLLKGKVLNKAKSFKILFAESSKKNFDENECLAALSGCKIVLFLDVEFDNRVVFGSYEVIAKVPIPLPSEAKFERGKDFQIEVLREDNGFKLVYGDGNIDSYEFKEGRTSARYILIIGDIYIFNNPEFFLPE